MKTTMTARVVLPLLMMLLLGMLDFGKAFNSWIDETHMANVGARLASVGYPAIVGTCDGDETFERLRTSLAASGCRTVRPQVT